MQNRFLIILLICLSIDGCSLAPDYERPNIDMKDQWHNGASRDAKVTADWWKQFRSKELNGLIKQALVYNNDIRAAADRIEQSRASAKIANASLLPSLGVSANTTTTGTFTGGKPSTTSAWGGSTNMAYELDLFGANRSNSEATEYEFTASVFDRDALILTVTGDVAENYFNILGLRKQIKNTEESLQAVKNVTEIIKFRYARGAVSQLEVSQQQEIEEQTQALLSELVQQEEQAEDALAILEGSTPQDFSIKGDDLDALVIPSIDAAHPVALLTRRPDIRADEERLKAANANIGIARAAFFPSFNLTPSAMLAAASYSTAATKSLDFVSSLTTPIFEGGALSGGLELSKAQHDELVETYGKTVRIALQEVEDALAMREAAQKNVDSLGTAHGHAQRAYALSLAQYKAGAVDFQTLLSAQRDLLAASNSYVVAQYGLFQASVELFRALGGGWTESH
jgi:NodT family efflux transporter outer membrane factor (OMF) lipoprotein